MTRRGHGEGSIYKRADGRWTGVIDLGWRNGKRLRPTVYGKTQSEALENLAALRRQVADGALPADGRITVAKYLQDWLTAKRNTVRPRTWHRYESYVRIHIEPSLGKMRLAKLAPADLDRLYAERLVAGLSPMTVRHLHTVLHGALKQAMRRGLVPRNVTEFVDPPRASRYEIRTLTVGEAREVLAAAADDPLEALYVLALTTGLRQGELLALRWRDVDLPNGMLQVRGTLQRGHANELEITEPKTRTSIRRVLLPQVAIDALARHVGRQEQVRSVAGDRWYDQGLVFTNEHGRPINASNLRGRSFQPLLKRAGLVGLRFHDLRHSAATLLLEQNVHPKVVSEMLGHADIGITLDLYSHVTPTLQAQAASAFDDLLGDGLAVNLAVKRHQANA